MAAHYQYQPKRKKLPWFRWFFATKIREVRCTMCGRPYIEHPDREPDFRISENNVELMLYTDLTNDRFGYRARVGVWHLLGDQFHFGQLFSASELKCLVEVIKEAVEFIQVEKEVNQKGAIEKMSSQLPRNSSSNKEEYGNRKKATL